MGAPDSGMQAAEQGAADSLLTAFRTIKADERVRHAGVLDYWLSIRGNKEFPPLHDLDPLELSDAGPSSVLLELISGGQDAEVRHLGDDLKGEIAVDRIIDAPNPSILGCIARKLPIVAISRDFLAFEDSYDTADGWTRCWVTLLPLSSCGSWVDYVYAFVSVERSGGKAARPDEALPEEAVAVAVAGEPVEPVADEIETGTVVDDRAIPIVEVAESEEPVIEEAVEPEAVVEELAEPEPVEEFVEAAEPEAAIDETPPEESVQPFEEPEAEQEPEEAVETPRTKGAPGFAKLFEGFANLTGFYGQSVNIDPAVPIEPEGDDIAETPEPGAIEPETAEAVGGLDELAAEPAEDLAEQTVPEPTLEVTAEDAAPVQPEPAMEGSLHSKLIEVRAKADEARNAALRATAALHEGLSAAYDFALDAETSPEEYLRLVEAQGLKIQLRAPMAPVVKLAFDGLADAATIKQLEAVLAWALKEELPRGELGPRIEEAGGIVELLNGTSRSN